MRAWMRFPPLPPAAGTSVLRELREGWRAFTSRRWLWAVVVQFSLVNAIFAGALGVLGPVIADDHLGGARSWGLILAAEAAGAVLGATIMVRYRPARLVLAASLAVPVLALPLLALAVPLSVPVIAAAALVAGVAVEVLEVNWVTAMPVTPRSRARHRALLLSRPRDRWTARTADAGLSRFQLR